VEQLELYRELVSRAYPQLGVQAVDVASRLLVGGWYLGLEDLIETSKRLIQEDSYDHR
jgi:hypothetical protein